MKYSHAKQGWYKLLHPDKFIKVMDEHMQSSRDGYVLYKSSLEKKMLQYCDLNKFVTHFSLEPFPIPYVKPIDGKVHRYYIDFFLEFSSGDKILVEIKSFNETVPPTKPKRINSKTVFNYNQSLQTYIINQAKWKAARDFAEKRNMKFVVMTERELL